MLYLAVMLRFAMQQHGLLESGLRSQIEKEALSEQLMAQSRDLERLNTERSRFFASASHDLRQPVHALALFSEALRRDLHDHPARPMADRVVEATRSVSELLNAMLDISKIDAGAVRPACRCAFMSRRSRSSPTATCCCASCPTSSTTPSSTASAAACW